VDGRPGNYKTRDNQYDSRTRQEIDINVRHWYRKIFHTSIVRFVKAFVTLASAESVKWKDGNYVLSMSFILSTAIYIYNQWVYQPAIKNWHNIWSYHNNWLPFHPMMSHKTADGSLSGVLWMQFIAECGIEYGCQIVTQFFLNLPDCLYLKKSWEFLQSYEKSREMQKKSALFFSFPRRSNFGKAKITKKSRSSCKKRDKNVGWLRRLLVEVVIEVERATKGTAWLLGIVGM
jgi:hypothetical protein